MKNLQLNIFDPKGTIVSVEKGCFLISNPFLPGPFFDRSIIYIVEHNKNGTIGYVINKPTKLYPDEVIKGLYNFSGSLYLGGPVGESSVNFIHKLGELIPNSRAISKTLSWGGDFKTLKELINIGVANSNNIKFFAGYSIWTKGQLQDEIDDKGWIVAKFNDNKLFSNTTSTSWEECMKELGGAYETWASFPKNPSLN